jgi:hypothetical protein
MGARRGRARVAQPAGRLLPVQPVQDVVPAVHHARPVQGQHRHRHRVQGRARHLRVGAHQRCAHNSHSRHTTAGAQLARTRAQLTSCLISSEQKSFIHTNSSGSVSVTHPALNPLTETSFTRSRYSRSRPRPRSRSDPIRLPSYDSFLPSHIPSEPRYQGGVPAPVAPDIIPPPVFESERGDDSVESDPSKNRPLLLSSHFFPSPPLACTSVFHTY